MSLTLNIEDGLPTTLSAVDDAYVQRAIQSRPAKSALTGSDILRQVPWDLIGVLTLTGALMALSSIEAASGIGVPRLLLAVPVLLLLPGYALTVLLFAKVGQVNWIERLGLSLAFSVAVVVFTCLGLFFMGTPLDGHSILLGIASVNGPLAVGAIVRRYALPQPERFEPWAGWRFGALSNGPDRLTMAGIALLVALGLGAVGYTMTNGTSREWLTEFAVVADDVSEGGALALDSSGKYNLTLSVTNHEESALDYSVRVIADGQQVGLSSTGNLQPGEGWHGQVSVAARKVTKSGLITMELWLPGSDKPYRELHIRTATTQNDTLRGAR